MRCKQGRFFLVLVENNEAGNGYHDMISAEGEGCVAIMEGDMLEA